MALRDFEAFLATPGAKTDAEVVAAMARTGVGAADVARLTNLPVDEVSARVNAVRETSFTDFLMTPDLTDAQIVEAINQNSISPERVSALTGVPVAEVQSRIAAVTQPKPVTPPPVTPPPVPRPVTPPPTTTTNLGQFQNFLMQPDLTDAQIVAEMRRLGISGQQVSDVTGLPINEVQNRISSLMPFANATQGFEQKFRNYTSIPIGAQYNPAVTGGMSPYAQVMGQMRPLTNPYATVQSGLSMGGYDPNIYDRNLLSNFVAERAADAAAERGEAVAAQQAAEYGGYNGGLITKVMGPKPPTPDDGTMFVQKGEYIIKKDAVNKYGKGLLDMVNEGKVPAAKMKSLLN